MAINFLNTVDLNQNQLNKAALQNLATDPSGAGSGVEGQVYFNTVSQTIRVYREILPATDPKTFEWSSISGDVSSVTASTANNRKGIAVADSAGPDPVVGLDIIGQTNLATTPQAADELLIYDNSATTNKSITVENLVGGFETTYTLPVTVGVVSPNAPTSGKITLTGTDGANSVVNFIGTTGRVDVSGTPGTSAITVDLTDSITIVDNINLGGVITQAGGISTTGVNAAALTASTTLILTANNAAVLVGMQISGTGIPDNITVTTVTDAKTFQLSGAITIANAITITFEEVNNFSSPLSMNNNRIHEVKTGILGTDGVNLGQVELLVAGIGVFKGSYNAATNSPALTGASNIALDQGDYFVVSIAGTFLTEALEPGDFIFANNAIAAGSTPAIANYTIVQADANIAGKGATDGGTQKGVAGFDSANFDVSSSGWVQLVSQKNPYGRKQALNNTAPSSRAVSGGVTTFTIDLANASLFGTGALSENIAVEVTQIATPFQTVYAEVTRSGSASMAIAFTGDVAIDIYRVLLTHV